MEQLYRARTHEQRLAIDRLVAAATPGEMHEARHICDAIVRGYYFDCEKADPKALAIANAFLGQLD